AAGDAAIFSLPRYPLEAITTLELREGFGQDWTALDAGQYLGSVSEKAGLLFFHSQPGGFHSQLRITFTGGYWFDTIGGQSQPSGSAALPADLLEAWLQQCDAVWQSLDHTGARQIKPELAAAIRALDLIPSVAATLRSYRRL